MIKYLLTVLALTSAISVPCLSNTHDNVLNKVQDDPNRNIQNSMFAQENPLNPLCSSWYEVVWIDGIYNAWAVCDMSSIIPGSEPTVIFVGSYAMGSMRNREGLVYADQETCTLKNQIAVIAKCAPGVEWNGRFPTRSFALTFPND